MPAFSTPSLATAFCHFRSRSRRLTATSTGTPTPKPIRPMRGSGSNCSRACGTLRPLYYKHGSASQADALRFMARRGAPWQVPAHCDHGLPAGTADLAIHRRSMAGLRSSLPILEEPHCASCSGRVRLVLVAHDSLPHAEGKSWRKRA